MSLPKDKSQVPDVFINLYKHSLMSKSRIAYCRIKVDIPMGVTINSNKASELDTKYNPKWVLLTGDIFSDIDKSQAVGYLNFK